MDYRQLGSTSLRVPPVGFGCAALGGPYGDVDAKECTRAVHHAIDSGITFFDTSAYYGETLSETRLGRALAGKRDQVTLATKGGRHSADRFDFSAKNIIRMCEDSLTRLQTDYLDIYQLHDIEFGKKAAVREGIEALQHLKKSGKVRNIGVTGYPLHLLAEVAKEEELDVVLSYCHGNLMNNRINDLLVPVIQAKGMGLINASVTHMGILTPHGAQDWHPAPEMVKKAGRKAAQHCASKGANLAELAIQFSLLNHQVDLTLLGTRTVAELENSLVLLNRAIDEDLLADVRAIIEPVYNTEWASGLKEH
ncbi:MAG: aldo/keto reductase [Verrucomicrobiales bacterium]|nr:aldo/keto reductase [Verrucomicrobiales bacterium]